MADRNFDKLLGIKTVGIREWRGKTNYNRYEATPYKALEALFQVYKLNKNDRVVDFGSGRGRVAFYIHNRFHVPVTGIEANPTTYDEALDNKMRYRHKAKHIKAPIRFEYGLAEDYEIKPEENVFYFFNPFTVEIFKKVFNNILQSLEKHPRLADVVLYYPMPKYKEFLKNQKSFRILNKIRVPGADDIREKFIIYRFD